MLTPRSRPLFRSSPARMSCVPLIPIRFRIYLPVPRQPGQPVHPICFPLVLVRVSPPTLAPVLRLQDRVYLPLRLAAVVGLSKSASKYGSVNPFADLRLAKAPLGWL